ncbi:sensor histidine kinase N-terminal domain-containing protein [Xenorhabdus sp. 42]|uniref:histidine kinase n=1 Tax=Xenorhabdus szentirmaii TaxID=290112 RepID=A0AAW3YSN6_9GAMM|nr:MULTISPECIES: sensor histidine kinase N-terminal domain-containing protein [unclassified Xenorhabdus]MBD2792303.1 sensor histidine kinase N-terminal domain-containing protein [Xenorhabdus sp. CUL]MBD2800940.1 sensor histidine kinase N-terminal domain-containing protein [Xenorhabdus sp. M]MBD2806225.1 sensor histidine kinase N-terminal domain-containing protein [Xenorhabdus sp. ZM]MBD2819299.1 sensor histidine kinase N-terminal domain-containing protein [Xenorhabdus sp. 42]MBD2823716.1 senso
MKYFRMPESLFNQLLLFFGIPLLLLGGVSVYSQYISVKSAATSAYDRTLLASARTVAERLTVRGDHLLVDVPYVVLDSFERNTNDRLYYQVISPEGKTISGYDDLPLIPKGIQRPHLYTALAYFYDAEYRGQPIRVVAQYQPINEGGMMGMALILVAETVISREYMVHQLLLSSLVGQGTVLLLTLILAYILLKRLLEPLQELSNIMRLRSANDLTPLPDMVTWSEISPLLQAFNRYIERLKLMVVRQGRFSADVSHQLRTPLAVLKTQVAVARNDQEPEQREKNLTAINNSLDNMISLIDRLLQLSQLKAHASETLQDYQPVNIVDLLQQACYSRFQQAEIKDIDLGYEGEDALWIKGEPLLLTEMCANLLDNAIKYTPHMGIVTGRVKIAPDKKYAYLEIEDSGPGIAQKDISQSLLAFNRLDNMTGLEGAGLGLTIVKEISQYHSAVLRLLPGNALGGLLVRVIFRLSPSERST